MYERNEAPQEGVDQRRSGPSAMLIAFVVIAVVAVVFILQNGDSTQTDFLMIDFQAPKWVLLAITLGVGVALDRLFALWWRRRGRRND